MKISIYCLLIALLLNYAYGQLANAISGTSNILIIQFVDSEGNVDPWMTVENFDKTFPKHGFDPKSTKIFSTKKPMFRQNLDTRWEIIFPN